MRLQAAVPFVGIALLLGAGTARAQTAVFVVRHAEKFSDTDERLTEAGKARARRLAAMLGGSGISAIYSTATERTLGTAQPLADRLQVAVAIYDRRASLAERIRAERPNDVILVVGHSNTVPDLLKAFGCAEAVTIADDEYDNLFVVVPKKDGKATLLRLRY